MRIPTPPPGSGPLARFLREVVECLRQLDPKPGPDTFTSRTTRGTIRSAKPRVGGGKSPKPTAARYA